MSPSGELRSPEPSIRSRFSTHAGPRCRCGEPPWRRRPLCAAMSTRPRNPRQHRNGAGLRRPPGRSRQTVPHAAAPSGHPRDVPERTAVHRGDGPVRHRAGRPDAAVDRRDPVPPGGPTLAGSGGGPRHRHGGGCQRRRLGLRDRGDRRIRVVRRRRRTCSAWGAGLGVRRRPRPRGRAPDADGGGPGHPVRRRRVPARTVVGPYRLPRGGSRPECGAGGAVA